MLKQKCNSFLKVSYSLVSLSVVLKESAGGDLQSPLTPESINGTDDERTPDVTQNSEPRAEPAQNALPFAHRYTFNSAIMIK